MLIRFLFIVLSMAFVKAASAFAVEIRIIDKTHSVRKLGIGEAYYGDALQTMTFKKESAKPKKNVFSFYGDLLGSTTIRVWGKMKGIDFNEILFIAPGLQTFTLNRVEDKIIFQQEKATKIWNDYLQLKNAIYPATLSDKLPASTLRKFISDNPNSEVGMFSLINQIFEYDFDIDFLGLDTFFLGEILSGKHFRYLKETYYKNNLIPSLYLINSSESTQLISFQNRSKPMLFEFWFNGCQGCLEKFSFFSENKDSIELYFDMVAINIQKELDFSKWKNIISENPIVGENYWDKDTIAISPFISPLYKFPSNIIVSKQGVIIARDADFSTVEKIIEWGRLCGKGL